jgi:hypothetical protein
MQIPKKTGLALGCLSIGAMALLAGCQCCPPVRECTTIQKHCEPCPPPLRTTSTVTSQECPDGIHRLAGAPLYYESQNLNWEQAPPYGRW